MKQQLHRQWMMRATFALFAVTLLLCLPGCSKKTAKSGEKSATSGSNPSRSEANKPEKDQGEAKETQPISRAMLGIFKVLPKNFDSKANPPTPAKLHLGKLLFFEKRVSRSGTIACNSCHNLSSYGVDFQATSPGHAGKLGDRNSPTVFNAAGHFRQFWDGREPDVEAQAKGPVLNAVEHGLKDAAEVEQILQAIPGYVVQFKRAFPKAGDKAVTFDNFAKAIGAFERKLVTPAPWDAFLAGDDSALTLQQKKGARLFFEFGCIACHNGALLGGTSYQKLGKVKPWPRLADEGRKKVTGKAEDLHVFKVPSLRNVAKTMPYFHDGKTEKLGEAVRLMALHQLGRDLSTVETETIVAFLTSLTGNAAARWTDKPRLPADSVTKPTTLGQVQAKPDAVIKPKQQPRADVVPLAPTGPGSAPPPPLPVNDVPPPAEK